MKFAVLIVVAFFMLCLPAASQAQVLLQPATVAPQPVPGVMYVPTYKPQKIVYRPYRPIYVPVYRPIQSRAITGGYIYNEQRFGLFGNKGRSIQYYQFK